MNLANKITVFRIVLVPIYLILLMQQTVEASLAATAVFALASASDVLDGYIARSRGLVTNFGKFFDPLADKLLVCSALIAMTYLGYFPLWGTILIVVRELTITAFREVAAANDVIIAADKFGKIKAAAQMITVICLTIPQLPHFLQILIQPLVWFTVAMTLISGATYITKNIHVLKD
ncbi:MAG: CDP-diacylglycerol--glycerol-3-phosphate 3-phosphatidyltransferase [Defluviitaleaceae bacterium]|nr:CDP-diacylglycerol--glycerol-3-phosphate 3-phosphatidyltransferase [Defluviitaleaceae bacterium]